jgi:predicted  nucleic acid-binding Zn-ribbon protein
MEGKGERRGRSLSVIESVQCLECGSVYVKPAGGGTARDNPGCPDCGYVGWLSVAVPVNRPSAAHRLFAGRLRRRNAQAG